LLDSITNRKLEGWLRQWDGRWDYTESDNTDL
jgi:hypothetical protein